MTKKKIFQKKSKKKIKGRNIGMKKGKNTFIFKNY